MLLKWPGKNPKLPSVLLDSHTNVVPVESHKWTYPPFGAHIDSDGNIYAKGSQGFVMNMQPSEAEAGIDIRVPPTADQEALERRIAEEWAPVSRNMTFEFINQHEYLKGIDIYASIIKACASYAKQTVADASGAFLVKGTSN